MLDAGIIVAAEPLTRFVQAIFEKRGMPQQHARQVAETLVWADLRGVGSHGVFRVPRYLAFIDRGAMDPAAEVELRLKLPAAVVFEAHRAPGAVAMMKATQAACDQARSSGLCYAIVSHTTHTGAIGYFAQWAAERGCAAIVASAGTPNMAYHGARVPSLSTSPIAIAVPGGEAGPLALDMSTAILGIGRLAQAREAGEPLPEGVVLDDAGNPTTDPVRASLPIPLGGTKGSGLALMLECLAGLMAGTPILAAMVGPGGKVRHAHNGLIIALDVAQFRPLADFKADVEALVAAIKALPRRTGVTELLLPGERGHRVQTEQLERGVKLSNATWADLERLSAQMDLTLPAQMP